jgi:hypothetical protein
MKAQQSQHARLVIVEVEGAQRALAIGDEKDVAERGGERADPEPQRATSYFVSTMLVNGGT